MSRAKNIIETVNEELNLEQKLKIIKKKGSILSIRKDVKWPQAPQNRQVMSNGIEKSRNIYKETSFRILGRMMDGPWASSLEELVSQVDWKDYEDRKNFSK